MISKIEFKNIIDVHNQIAKPIGSSAHVLVPKNWVNKKVIVLLLRDDE